MRLEQKGHCHTEPWHAGTWDTQTWGTHRHGGHTGHTDTYGIHRHTGHMDTWTHGTHGHTGHMDTGDTQTHGCWATFQLTKGCALTELLPLLCSGSVPAQWKWCCVPHGLAGISALLPAEGGGGRDPSQHSTALLHPHSITYSAQRRRRSHPSLPAPRWRTWCHWMTSAAVCAQTLLLKQSLL